MERVEVGEPAQPPTVAVGNLPLFALAAHRLPERRIAEWHSQSYIARAVADWADIGGNGMLSRRTLRLARRGGRGRIWRAPLWHAGQILPCSLAQRLHTTADTRPAGILPRRTLHVRAGRLWLTARRPLEDTVASQHVGGRGRGGSRLCVGHRTEEWLRCAHARQRPLQCATAAAAAAAATAASPSRQRRRWRRRPTRGLLTVGSGGD